MEIVTNKGMRKMHRPGIGPGPPAWQAEILPLDQRCLHYYNIVIKLLNKNALKNFLGKK